MDPDPVGTPGPPDAPGDIIAIRCANPAVALILDAEIRQHPGQARSRTVRSPDDDAVWMYLSHCRDTDIALAWALGGEVHHGDGADLVGASGRVRWEVLRDWPEVSWIELATVFPPDARIPAQPELLIVTAGPLVRWIVQRCQLAGMDVRVATARLRALFRAQQDWPALFVRAGFGDGRNISTALVAALVDLPHTVVCRGERGGRLLVDQRLELPLADEVLANEVPPEEEWLLTGGLGAWRVTERGAERVPPLRAVPSLCPPSVPGAGRLPPDLRTELSIVAEPSARSVDAVLIGDEDLLVLRRYLTGQPAVEHGFLVLGPGRHLYAEPGEDVSAIPVGTSLCRIGPGALYLQSGRRISPPLSAAGRAAQFGMDDSSAVVLHDGSPLRLSLRNTVPVWALWLGESVVAGAVVEPLSEPALAILAKVDEVQARVEAPQQADDLHVGERNKDYLEGFELEQRGRFAEAAHKYWEAGRPLLAAKLYERAAGIAE